MANWNDFRPANPQYEIKYNENAWFSPWSVREVRIEGVGYKHYREVRAFVNNADALAFCDKLNGTDKQREFKPQGRGIYK